MYILYFFNYLVASIYWLLLLLVLYTFFGYPLLLSTINLLRKKIKTARFEFTPRVSLIILAGNDRKTIEAKLENCLSFEYPKEKLEIIVAAVNSKDNTAKLVENYFKKKVKLLFQAENPSESRVINSCVSEASGEVIIFTDAVSEIEKFSIKNLARHFAEPKVGLVAGNTDVSGVVFDQLAAGELFSLKYERAVMSNSSKVGKLSRVSPELFGVRKADFQELRDDGVPAAISIPLMYSVSGKLCLFEPLALAVRPVLTDSEQMIEKKIIGIKASLRSATYVKELFRSKQYLALVQLVSYELLYQNYGVLLLALFLFNIFAMAVLFKPEYVLLLSIQFLFYVAGALKLWHIPYFVLLTAFAGIKVSFTMLNKLRIKRKEKNVKG